MLVVEANLAIPPDIKPLDLTGRERQLRSALATMDRIAVGFCRAARRSLPFLTRYRARVTPTPVSLLPPMLAEGTASFAARIERADGTAHGCVSLDANAIAIVLEGALGGGLIGYAQPPGPELTPAQRALVSRIARSLALDLATAIKAEADIDMQPVADSPTPKDAPTGESLYVICEMEGLSSPAAITISASAEALESAAQNQESEEPTGQIDPRVAEAINEVPVEVVAELGRISIGVGTVLRLRPGDIIRLPTAPDDTVRVYAAGVHKFDGVPVTSRGQLAIEIKARNTE